MSNQAIVHIVNGGGTRTISRLCAQWDYITRKGAITLKRSERYAPATLPYSEFNAWARGWHAGAATYDIAAPHSESPHDVTTHIVVSFPEGTSDEAAEAAGRDWAREMFQPDINDPENAGLPDRDLLQYDYVTALHRDTRHPHLHIIVRRRPIDGYLDEHSVVRRPLLYIYGAENGTDPAARSRMNCDNMRRVMARVAHTHGIPLQAAQHGHGGITMGQHHQQQREDQRRVIIRSHDENGYVEAGPDNGGQPPGPQPGSSGPRPGDGQWVPPTVAGPSNNAGGSRSYGQPHRQAAPTDQAGGGSGGGAGTEVEEDNRRRHEDVRPDRDQASQSDNAADGHDDMPNLDDGDDDDSLYRDPTPNPPGTAGGGDGRATNPSAIDDGRRNAPEDFRAARRSAARRGNESPREEDHGGADGHAPAGDGSGNDLAPGGPAGGVTGRPRATEAERLHEGEPPLQPGRTRGDARRHREDEVRQGIMGPRPHRDSRLRDTAARQEREERVRQAIADLDAPAGSRGPRRDRPGDRGRTR